MNVKKVDLPLILRRIYEAIPEPERRRILADMKGYMNKRGTSIRLQPLIPNEVYVMLHYFNAFMGSASDFYTMLSCDWIERKAIAQGLLNVMNQKNGGR